MDSWPGRYAKKILRLGRQESLGPRRRFHCERNGLNLLGRFRPIYRTATASAWRNNNLVGTTGFFPVGIGRNHISSSLRRRFGYKAGRLKRYQLGGQTWDKFPPPKRTAPVPLVRQKLTCCLCWQSGKSALCFVAARTAKLFRNFAIQPPCAGTS